MSRNYQASDEFRRDQMDAAEAMDRRAEARVREQVSPPLQSEPRTIEEALADLRTRMRTLPLTDPRRATIAAQIVGIEDAITARAAAREREP